MPTCPSAPTWLQTVVSFLTITTGSTGFLSTFSSSAPSLPQHLLFLSTRVCKSQVGGTCLCDSRGLLLREPGAELPPAGLLFSLSCVHCGA